MTNDAPSDQRRPRPPPPLGDSLVSERKSALYYCDLTRW
jgi:hypothetical protein